MTPTVRIDLDNPTPPYEQLRCQFALFIETGQIVPGERLPPLRQLARDLGLAVGTVARAYRELEAAGLISSRRGAGTRVVAVAQPGKQLRLEEAALVYARTARALGATQAETRYALESALAALDAPVGSEGPA